MKPCTLFTDLAKISISGNGLPFPLLFLIPCFIALFIFIFIFIQIQIQIQTLIRREQEQEQPSFADRKMARGKIQIKRIENSTNRQVTYSKRRNGLFKKANELTVLCDAKVSIIMISSTGKLHEFISPSTSTKQIYDQYQKALGIDIWCSHYERMQEHLKKLKDVNKNLRTEIRQRMGDCLNDLSYEELCGLEQDMESSVKIIRDRKYKVLNNQIETQKKKKRNVEEIHRNLLHQVNSKEEDPQYGLVDNGVDYNSILGFSNGGHGILALRLQPNHHNLHDGAGSDLTTYALL